MFVYGLIFLSVISSSKFPYWFDFKLLCYCLHSSVPDSLISFQFYFSPVWFVTLNFWGSCHALKKLCTYFKWIIVNEEMAVLIAILCYIVFIFLGSGSIFLNYQLSSNYLELMICCCKSNSDVLGSFCFFRVLIFTEEPP